MLAKISAMVQAWFEQGFRHILRQGFGYLFWAWVLSWGNNKCDAVGIFGIAFGWRGLLAYVYSGVSNKE